MSTPLLINTHMARVKQGLRQLNETPDLHVVDLLRTNRKTGERQVTGAFISGCSG